MLGTPNLGLPKALKVMRYGNDLDVSLLRDLVRPIDVCKVKRAAHNLPGFFNMIPGERYFEATGGYFCDQADIDGDGIKGLLDFHQTVFNLKNGMEHICRLERAHDVGPFDRLSSRLLDNEFLNVYQSRDHWKRPDGVDVFLIAGYNKPTIAGVVEFIRKGRHEIQLMQGNADGTVPVESALGVDATEHYFADMLALKASHDSMLANSEIQS
jgi:hypothetical protein